MHRLAHLAFGVCLIIAMAVSAGAWRLAQGPVDVSWLTRMARTALLEDGGPLRVSFGDASLTWGGLGDRMEHLLEMRVSDITVSNQRGQVLAQAPRAWMTFSVPGLLAGRFIPRAVEIDDARVSVPSGSFAGARQTAPSDGSPDVRQIARELADDVNGGGPRLVEELRHVHIHNASFELPQPLPALPLKASGADLDLVRQGHGHLHGVLAASLSVGDELGDVDASLDLVRDADSHLTLALSPLRPAAFGFLPEAAGVDVPVGVDATLTFDRAFNVRGGQATLRCGAGTIRVAKGFVPLRRGTIDLSATPDSVTITRAVLDVAPTAIDPPAMLRISGTVHRKADRVEASANLGLDNVNLAELPQMWPAGLGGGVRPWVVEHVLHGTVAHGAASFALETDAGLKDVVLTKATGDIDGSDVAFTWIDNVPPIEQAEVHLQLLTPDAMDITVPSGRQRVGGNQPDLQIENGILHITGLSRRDQFADIHVQTEGPLTSALALLKAPRLHLLSNHPISFDVDAGKASAALDFQFPMNNWLTMDDVAVRARARLTDVRLPRIVSTNTLDKGALDLTVTKDGLRMQGEGALASIPVKLQGMMDFTAGPPNQVVQKVVVTGQPTVPNLRSAGVDLSGLADGTLGLTVAVVDHRTGPETVSIDGDLTGASLTVAPLGWSKPVGGQAGFTAALSLQRGLVIGIDRFAVTGDQLAINGVAKAANGRITSVTLDQLHVGRTSGRGTVQLAAGQPVGIVLTASILDLSGKIAAKSPGAPPGDSQPVTTPRWILDGRFNRVILANDVTASNMLVKARGDGEAVQSLDVIGTIRDGSERGGAGPGGAGSGGAGPGAAGHGGLGQEGSNLSVRIQPEAGRRHLRIESQDAGTVLRGLDVVRVMRDGHLVVDGWFDTADRYSPLVGAAIIENTQLTRSPSVVKLLQAVTIYGIADVMRGPGLRISKIDIPFEYNGGLVTVRDASAYNAALGMTARGSIGLRAGFISADGTVVPAYFFNSMLGGLPVVGKWFSPEKGGGVFAVGFGLSGDLDDPQVTVNPVSALTPGFLRNLFGKPDHAGLASRSDPANR